MKEERGGEEKIGTGGEREERQVQGEEDEPGEVEEEGGGGLSPSLSVLITSALTGSLSQVI